MHHIKNLQADKPDQAPRSSTTHLSIFQCVTYSYRNQKTTSKRFINNSKFQFSWTWNFSIKRTRKTGFRNPAIEKFLIKSEYHASHLKSPNSSLLYNILNTFSSSTCLSHHNKQQWRSLKNDADPLWITVAQTRSITLLRRSPERNNTVAHH